MLVTLATTVAFNGLTIDRAPLARARILDGPAREADTSAPIWSASRMISHSHMGAQQIPSWRIVSSHRSFSLIRRPSVRARMHLPRDPPQPADNNCNHRSRLHDTSAFLIRSEASNGGDRRARTTPLFKSRIFPAAYRNDCAASGSASAENSAYPLRLSHARARAPDVRAITLRYVNYYGARSQPAGDHCLVKMHSRWS